MEAIKMKCIEYQTVLFPVFDTLLNGVNSIFHIYISWYLTTEQYGILSALFAFLALMMVSGISIQIFVAKQVADIEWKDSWFRYIQKMGLRFTFLISLLIFLSIPILKIGLRAVTASIIIVIFIFATNSVVSLYRGVMQGKKCFIQLNINFYIEVLSKIIWLVVLLPLVKDLNTALLGLLIGMVLALWHGNIVINKLIILDSTDNWLEKEQIKGLMKTLGTIFLANFFLYYFTSINMMLVNYFLPEQSGIYAVSAKYSQIFVHVGFSITTVLIPVISPFKSNIKKFKREVSKYLLTFFIGGTFGLILYKTFIPATIFIIFDSRYHSAASYVFLEGVAFYFLILSYLIVTMEIVLNQSKYILYLGVAAVLLTLGILLNHDNLIQMIWVEVIVYLGLFIGMITSFYRRGEENEKNTI